jgi:DNA-binding LytR/AlgR family response regulator
MIRCIAVDDEKWALDLLADNIRQVPYLELVKCCKNAHEATAALQSENIDLVFLDIQMPGLSGLQFNQTLVDPPMIIFVTAYEQYALEGFNVSAVDYLLKPVSLERFMKACSKAKALYDLKQPKLATPHNKPVNHFFVNVEYSHVKIIIDDIKFIEGYKDYIKIHLTKSPRPVITRMSLKAIEEKLPANQFVRTHKSYIVSIPAITSIKRDYICLNDVELPVSESYKEVIHRIVGNSPRKS